MTHPELRALDGSTSAAFAPPVGALGAANFASELVAGLNRGLPVDDVCLMRFADRTRAPVLESASWRGGDHVGEVQKAYLAGLYRHDPNLFLPPAPDVRLRLLRRQDVGDETYRLACYQRAGIYEPERRRDSARARAGRVVAASGRCRCGVRSAAPGRHERAGKQRVTTMSDNIPTRKTITFPRCSNRWPARMRCT